MVNSGGGRAYHEIDRSARLVYNEMSTFKDSGFIGSYCKEAVEIANFRAEAWNLIRDAARLLHMPTNATPAEVAYRRTKSAEYKAAGTEAIQALIESMKSKQDAANYDNVRTAYTSNRGYQLPASERTHYANSEVARLQVHIAYLQQPCPYDAHFDTLRDIPAQSEYYNLFNTNEQWLFWSKYFNGLVYEWLSPLHGIVDLGKTLETGTILLHHIFCRTCVSGYKYVVSARISMEGIQKTAHPMVRSAVARHSAYAAYPEAHTDAFLSGPIA